MGHVCCEVVIFVVLCLILSATSWTRLSIAGITSYAYRRFPGSWTTFLGLRGSVWLQLRLGVLAVTY